MGASQKTNRVNLKWVTSLSGLYGSLNQRNRNTSLSFECMPIIKKAFSISAVSATRFQRNLTRMLNNLGIKLGPVIKQSLSENEFAADLADPS